MSAAPDSIRGQLESAMKAQAEPEVETPETPVAEATPAVESEGEKQERARDEKGRFAAKSEEPVRQQGVQPSAKPEVSTGVQEAPKLTESVGAAVPAAPEKEQAAALAPPNGWPAEAKAKWHELPPEIMAAVQKREQDVAKFTSTRDEHASFGKEIYQTVQPYMAQIQAEGGTPVTAIKSLLNTAYVLRTGTPQQKQQVLLNTARQFGVDLGTAKPNGQQPPTNLPPELAALQQEVAELKGQLSQREQAAQQQLQTEVQTEIAAFAADPKHPHYEAVKGHMSALIAQGLAKDLQDAYDQAVWARPDTRATLEAQKRAEEEQKRRAEAKRKADEAKRRNVSITGGPGNTAASAAPGGRSIREELEASLAAQAGGV
jgi:hypothetical protein